MGKQNNRSTLTLLPLVGIAIFTLLYFIATLLYPGGSDADKTAKGFSWLHNYWCELMAPAAQNGEQNSARPIAITAMFVLAISLSFFWYQIPKLFKLKKSNSVYIKCSGIGSMLVLPFLFTGDHDMVINIAGLLGCIAIILVLIKLYQAKMHGLFWVGILCLILCGINNLVYYMKEWLYLLPIIQKISFVVFLFWFAKLSLLTYQKEKSRM
jgi:hypothetical protein